MQFGEYLLEACSIIFHNLTAICRKPAVPAGLKCDRFWEANREQVLGQGVPRRFSREGMGDDDAGADAAGVKAEGPAAPGCGTPSNP